MNRANSARKRLEGAVLAVLGGYAYSFLIYLYVRKHVWLSCAHYGAAYRYYQRQQGTSSNS